MKRYGDLYPIISSRENIELAHQLAKRGKASRRDVQRFMKNEQRNLDYIAYLLQTRSFHTAEYRTKTIYEPKRREIFVLPYSPDRIVQQCAINVLEPIWTRMFIEDSYACIKGRGIHAGSLRTWEFVQKYAYCVQFDISKFYPSINHEILKQVIRKRIKCRGTLWLLDDIIDSVDGETNVPIGNITSQWFGNVLMNELDRYAKHILRIQGYIRYCDDFIIFSDDKEQLHGWADALEAFCNDVLKLRLSKKNLMRTQDGVDFLGYRHFSDFILLRTRTATRFRRAVKRVRKHWEMGWLETDRARSAAASLLGWTKHAKCRRLVESIGLRELYEEICKVSRRGSEVQEAGRP